MASKRRGKGKRLGKRTTEPTAFEREYSAKLETIRKKSEAAVDSTVGKVLKSTEEAVALEPARAKFLIRAAEKALSGIVDREQTSKYLAELSKRIAAFNLRQVTKSLGFEVPEIASGLTRAWVKQNVAIAADIPAGYGRRVAGVLNAGIERGSRVETIAKQLTEQLGVEKRAAASIAESQVLAVNAQLTEERHKKLGITEYAWQDSGDSAVRDWHHKLHLESAAGKRFKYSDPPVGGGAGPKDRGNPGSAKRCRCQAIPVVDRFAK